MRKYFKYVLIISMAMLAYACVKPDETTPDNGPHVIPDTPYVVSLPEHFPPMPSTPSNPLTKRGVELGRMLFYDPILSKDGTISCASCHNISHSFADNKQFSLGVDNTPGTINAMALINLAWQNKFFWNGRSPSIEHQALQPITNPIEMHETLPNIVAKLQSHAEYPTRFKSAFGTDQITSDLVAKAIAQFERTLVSGNALYDRFPEDGQKIFNGNKEALYGYSIFFSEKGQCFHCHGAEGTLFAHNLDTVFRNNGLLSDSELDGTGLGEVTGNSKDDGKFKVPTLRNVALTAPYMHDGRFNTLEEVMNFYAHGIHLNRNIDKNFAKVTDTILFYGGVHLEPDDQRYLIAFLKTLTDTTFTNKPEFKNPFK